LGRSTGDVGNIHHGTVDHFQLTPLNNFFGFGGEDDLVLSYKPWVRHGSLTAVSVVGWLEGHI
jgi:hypothetical protein